MRISTRILISLLLFVAPCFAQRQTFFAQNVPNNNSGSWTWYQDQTIALGTNLPCTSTSSTACTFNFLPTKAGSAIVVYITSVANVTISSVTGWTCGGTWTYNTPHLYDSTNTANTAFAANVGNTGGCTSMTVNVSAAPGANGITPGLEEFLPPAGATASIDTTSTSTNASCTNNCVMAPFDTTHGTALNGTDVVFEFGSLPHSMTNVGGPPNSGGTYNGCGTPFLQDQGGQCVALNVSPGSMTIGNAEVCTAGTCPSAQYADFLGIAFTSNYGTFTLSPSQIWSVVNMQLLAVTNQTTTCNPSCTLALQSTAGSKLFVLWAMSTLTSVQQTISSCTLGATSCTIPSTGSSFCNNFESTVGSINCAYILSDPSGQTSLSITMSTNDTYYFGAYEIGKSGGSVTLDTQGSVVNSSATNTVSGPTLTLSGTNDIVFQGIIQGTVAATCVQASNYYELPYSNWTNCDGQVFGPVATLGAVGFSYNLASAPVTTWSFYNGATSKSVVAALAFK